MAGCFSRLDLANVLHLNCTSVLQQQDTVLVQALVGEVGVRDKNAKASLLAQKMHCHVQISGFASIKKTLHW